VEGSVAGCKVSSEFPSPNSEANPKPLIPIQNLCQH
jgi:hypothetical protein